MIETIGSRASAPVLPTRLPVAADAPLPQDARAGAASATLLKASDLAAVARRSDDPQPAPTPDPQPKKWTILVYAAADNNLLSYETANLNDVEKVGSSDQVNVVAQFDEGGDKGCSRLYLQKARGGIVSPPVGQLGQVDMAAPETLADFVKWGVQNYPADHYMLIINDHGDGWRGCVEDDSAGTFMALPRVQAGLQQAQDATGVKLDVVGFDACLMGMEEVAHELKDNASFVVGSQETEGVLGWPYSNILSAQTLEKLNTALAKRLPTEPADVAKAVVTGAQGYPKDLPTMAAYDLSKEGALKDAMDSFADAITSSTVGSDVLAQAASDTQGFYDYKDLYDFCDRIATNQAISDDGLKASAQSVQQAIRSMVIAEQHSDRYPNAHGVSIELNSTGGGYGELTFARDSKWTAAQAKINGGQSLSPILSQVRGQLGPQTVTRMQDDRVTELHGFYVEGWESAWKLPDLQKTLGSDWKEVPMPALSLSHKLVLEKPGQDASQEIVFDARKGTTTLTSSLVAAGSFITEKLVLDREGRISRG